MLCWAGRNSTTVAAWSAEEVAEKVALVTKAQMSNSKTRALYRRRCCVVGAALTGKRDGFAEWLAGFVVAADKQKNT